ncbi:right-handed parallel beta-helix repeat-containing protein [Streptomyces sp. WMMC940]|uniref:right-handed parallel beta-helix repeat-containing protein n=1 Tax=Streptomyces sp. WMMC940 TaxID=3015153 RepID=UPI0022B658E5|nr:right-handed parallel beta-helix repeat-containing protein [Streptomyces sp. WMMC940]MCZ7457191.1 right-handed parallel beta-helix repeat-containing protein [Streptomyces sp. WMMC940]
MVAAAGFATIAGTTALVAVTDDDKAGAKTASAAADQAKGTTQPAPAKDATTRGGSAEDTEDDKDADYWAEHAGNPGWNDSDNTEDHAGSRDVRTGPDTTDSGNHDDSDADEDHDESSADQSHSGEPEGKPGPAAADTQKRAGNPNGPEGQNGPEGHSSHDRGHDGQGDHGEQTDHDNDSDRGRDGQSGRHEESGRQGQDGHRDSREAGDKARSVGCDPNDLISAIIDANSDGGGTLSLAEKCTYTLTANQDGNGLPEIIQPITIHGNGATIARAAGADQFRIFEVGTGGDLTLRHLTLTRGKAAADEDGGAINVNAAGRLTLDHTTLHNNTVDDTSTDNAGAIYNQGITTIRNSTLSKNSGEDGGAIHNDNGKLDIAKTELTRNTAGDGGAIYSAGSTTIDKSLFKSNTASGAGGALYVPAGATDIDSSAFLYNYAESGGGAFYNDGVGSLYVRSSTVARNTSDDGGGLYADGNSHTVISDSRFRGNTAFEGDGGGIYQDGDLALQRTVVSGNQAPSDGATGGGIYVGVEVLNLTDVEVTDNTSDTAPGGIDNNGTVTTHGKIKIIDNVPTNCEGSANPVPNCFG